MARRGSGLRTAIKIVKAIDRANKQAARDAERRRKAIEREEAKAFREQQKKIRQKEREEAKALREYQRLLKEQDREAKRAEKNRIIEEKQEFKNSLNDAQGEYLDRCSERSELRKQYIKQMLR